MSGFVAVVMLVRAVPALLAVLLLAACSGGSTTESFPAGANDGVLVQEADDSLFDFEAPKLGGGQVVGSELQNKDVALWFWAPW